MNNYWQDKKNTMTADEWDELMELRREAYELCGKTAPDPIAAERRRNKAEAKS